MTIRFAAFVLALLPAGFAAAHSSLAPHAHPHGDSALLSLDAALGAGIAVAALIAGAVIAVRALRAVKVRLPARRRP